MTTSPGVQDASVASASLLGATAARDRLAGRARWTRRYSSVFALTSLVMVPTIGLGGKGAVLPVVLVWLGVMVVWAKRQGVAASWLPAALVVSAPLVIAAVVAGRPGRAR